MEICCWNVNGLRALIKNGGFEWLKTQNFDIICLQETKAHPKQIPDEIKNLHNYYAYWASAEKKGYSGVVTFSRMEPLSVDYGFGKKEFDKEGRIIITKFPEFTLMNIYFPNGKMNDERLKYKLSFYDAAFNYFEKLRKNGEKLIIAGDFNTAHKEIDLAHPKANEKYSGFLPVERKWLDKLFESGYIDTFRYFHPEPHQYTWWSYRFNARAKNIGWRIDYFIVSNNLISRVKESIILQNIKGSDHAPIVIELN